MWLFIGCLLLVVILTFKYNYDKNVNRLVLILLAIMFAAVYGNADTESYLIEYTQMTKLDWTDTEPLWMLIQFCMNSLHIPFVVFRLLVFLSGTMLIGKTIEEITKDRNIVWIVYMIYPFMLDAAQIRNFFAMAIFVYSLKYLLDDNKISILKYIICIILATLVHNVFVVYIALVLIKAIDYRLLLTSIFVAFFSIGFMIERIPQLSMIIFKNYHGGSFARKYVTLGYVSSNMILALSAFYALCFVGCLFAHRAYKIANNKGTINNELFYKYDILLKVTIVLSLGLILNIFSMDLARIFRNILVVYYALLWEASKHSENKFVLRLILFICAGYACWLFVYYAYPDTIFWPTLQNNYFFEWFNLSY